MMFILPDHHYIGDMAKKIIDSKEQFAERNKLLGSLKGEVKIKGNIFSTGLKWHAVEGRLLSQDKPIRKSKRMK